MWNMRNQSNQEETDHDDLEDDIEEEGDYEGEECQDDSKTIDVEGSKIDDDESKAIVSIQK